MSGGYAVASTAKVPRRIPRITSSSQKLKRARHYAEEKHMKLTIKQRIRNWLMNDIKETEYGNAISIDEEGPDLNSQSFRLNIFSASGGTIVETTKYDRKNDENRHSLYVVTADKDLGEELGKIITMESLR
jgi:hypothetical protein